MLSVKKGRDLLSKGREAQSVVCPYFVRFSAEGIVCEGIYGDGVTEIKFAKRSKRDAHINRFCRRQCGAGEVCPIAGFFDDYYTELDRLEKKCGASMSADTGVRACIALDKDVLRNFKAGTLDKLILNDAKIYSSLYSALSSGNIAYNIKFCTYDGEAVIPCIVRRGFAPKDKGGIAGVVYWIVTKYEESDFLDLTIFGEKQVPKKGAKGKDGKKKTDKPDIVITPASFGDEIWGEILDEYLSKKISLSELARTNGVNYKTLYYKATHENWKDFRANYRKIVIKKTLNRLSNLDALKLKRLMQGCDRLNELIENCINDDSQPYLYIDDSGNEVKRNKINTKYLMEMSLLLDKQTKVTSALYGILTEPEAQRLDIERSRLDGNIARAVKSDDDNERGGVIMLPSVLDSSGDVETVIENEDGENE